MRVVLANIVSSVLIAMLPIIRRALTADGRAILSGMVFTERDEMLTALRSGGWRVEAEDREDDWWTVATA